MTADPKKEPEGAEGLADLRQQAADIICDYADAHWRDVLKGADRIIKLMRESRAATRAGEADEWRIQHDNAVASWRVDVANLAARIDALRRELDAATKIVRHVEPNITASQKLEDLLRAWRKIHDGAPIAGLDAEYRVAPFDYRERDTPAQPSAAGGAINELENAAAFLRCIFEERKPLATLVADAPELLSRIEKALAGGGGGR